MKKNLKFVIYAVLILCVLAIPCAIFGNPVSWVLVQARANSYLDATYPELDVKIDRIVYDFKHGGFYVDIVSPTSADTYFSLSCDGLGNVQYDRYDSVSSGGTTVARHSKAYQTLVDEAFRQPDSPFAGADVYSGLCTQADIEYYTVSTDSGTETCTMEKDFSLDFSAFELDQDYDINALGAAHGQLTVFVQDEEVSVERAAALLLELRGFLDEQGVPFYAVEFWLSPAEGAEGETICLWDFLYSDIYAEDLTGRVQQAHEEYQWHLERMN